MANTDSFIEEVNEELRRDRLYRLFRKWGWLPILVILILVGGAAWREYRIAQDRAEAEAFGDALITALDREEVDARIAGLQGVEATGQEAQMLVTLLLAAEQSTAGATEEAAANLRALAGRDDISRRYADLAMLKAHLLDPRDFESAMSELTQLARPGRPYRPLAMEQQALLHVGIGDREAAIDTLRLLEEDSQTTPGLQQRASQLIVALESGAALADPAPAEGGDVEPGDAPEEPGGGSGDSTTP
ncbi:hypothetical protein DZD18_04070 [Rhodobacteraceae bacterium W635]|uniref:hypothetical protein n=1 Tax=Nioella halotolerans TaxID=2303578 RepID=UPI000E3D7277|nr:hypothetical protein DZD18_04070 [Rhodobacteraceae bacterium W635]